MQAEKKSVDAKVARVRELVKNVSKEDVALALHHFDGDVERTIQAFCESAPLVHRRPRTAARLDGAEEAIGSWKSEPTKSERNKRRRRDGKAANGGGGGSTGQSTDTSPYPSSVVTERDCDTPLSAVINDDWSAAAVNGVGDGYGAPAATAVNGNAHLPLPQRPARTKTLQPARGASAAGGGRVSSVAADWAPTPPAAHDDPIGEHGAVTKKALVKEAKALARHDSVIERVQMRFNDEVDKGATRMRRVFQDMRTILAERETHLQAELERCKDEGHRVLGERLARSRDLHRRGERVAAMSNRELAEFRSEIKGFVGERKYEEELGQTIRFQWDEDAMLEMIKNFGEVVPVKPILPQKHSSHSSLVSSIGEDSGLGMVSPVSSDEKKAMAEVESGGITMKSESLTKEQLEDLNRRLQESLQLQGITADILSGVGGATSTTRRRPAAARGGGGGRGGRGRGGARGPPPNRPAPLPELSILQP